MQKLGQHFLTNEIKLQKIVRALDLKADDTVIEIGPGHGELTEVLVLRLEVLGKNWKIIAIEKDPKLAENLESKIQNLGLKNIKVIEGDVLKILPELPKTYNLKPYTYKVVGNIPFYITGFLLRSLGELEPKPELIVLTVQKEVAERVCAQPPKMNLLAASVQFWAEPKIIDYIPKTDFQPQPKVDSAVIKLTTSDLKFETPTFAKASAGRQEIENYYRLIKILFRQPRKTILNNLRETNQPKEEIIKILGELKINLADRPQNLSVEQIKRLSTRIKY